jgi:hypothetical protein
MYKHNAIRRGLKWELTGEEFDKLIVKPCIYCGSDLLGVFRKTENNSSKKERVLYYNGIDRVDNSRGYVSGNVVPCCKFCNRAKKDSTEAEFTAYLKRVANFIKGTMQ